MHPRCTRDQAKKLGQMIREHRKSKNWSLYDAIANMNNKTKDKPLSMHDWVQIESKGTGLSTAPFLLLLLELGLLKKEDVLK